MRDGDEREALGKMSGDDWEQPDLGRGAELRASPKSDRPPVSRGTICLLGASAGELYIIGQGVST